LFRIESSLLFLVYEVVQIIPFSNAPAEILYNIPTLWNRENRECPILDCALDVLCPSLDTIRALGFVGIRETDPQYQECWVSADPLKLLSGRLAAMVTGGAQRRPPAFLSAVW
jgi:hypothetical protein